MEFLRKLARGAEFRAASGLANPAGWLVDALAGPSASFSGQRVTVDRALQLGAVFSAVEKISEAVGTLPLKVFRISDNDDRLEARAHRTWRMLHDQPNEYTTAHRFWSTVSAQLLLWGNVYIYKERGFDQQVESLWLLDPAVIQLEWDSRTQTKRFVRDSQEGRRIFTTEEVIHIPAFTLDGIYGCSRISYCRQTLGTALARAEFEGTFYRQGARIPGVIEYPGKLTEQATKNLSEGFSRWHSGSANMHKVPVLEDGASFKGVSMPLQDMEFVSSQQLSLTEIAVMFNLPPAYLGGSTGDSLTYATTESNQIQFAQMAISPLTNSIAKSLTSDPAILPQNVMYCEFVLEGLLRADMKTRSEYWKTMKDVLGLKPDFIASRENIPPDALEPPQKPPVLPASDTSPLPPEMVQMQNALKQSSA